MTDSPWPMFDLRLRTDTLELRTPDDKDLMALAEVAAKGIHDSSWTPFSADWTNGTPQEVKHACCNGGGDVAPTGLLTAGSKTLSSCEMVM